MTTVETEEQPPNLPRYFLHISYEGTNYHGWQVQPNGHTVQAELESAMRKILRQEKVITLGCGRTDAGVHARKFYLHFNAEKEIEDPVMLLFKLNNCLPHDLAVHEIIRVHDKAHARFDATQRTYEYHVHQEKDPFIYPFSKFYPFPLDDVLMNEAASLLPSYSNFASFRKTQGGQKTDICRVQSATWVRHGHRLVFTITADRFLRNMVRAIVGTHFDIGRGRMTLDRYREIIDSRDRSSAGDSISARGLHLVDIRYPYITGS